MLSIGIVFQCYSIGHTGDKFIKRKELSLHTQYNIYCYYYIYAIYAPYFPPSFSLNNPNNDATEIEILCSVKFNK